MKRKLALLLLIAGFCASTIFAQQFSKEFKVSDDGKYKYFTVNGDPMKVRVYTLSNGLTVMTSVTKKQPRVQTYIAVKAGSKNDPAENTGLAHYLEHMLFKGTDVYGTKDWNKEKVQLDKIDALYEVYNKTTDENKRKEIYHQIDSVSGVASTYAIANEYDKMLQSIGAKGTNAFTSLEQTVYVNDIPQNQIEKWIEIEAERFRNPILRLFHTELEAVYEEKNISLDKDSRKTFEAMLANLFKNHTYGTQTTIGTVEHLKNPSLIKIRNYFNTYYVPNNMAIILAGDFDQDAAVREIDAKFGAMKPKPVPEFTFMPEKPSLEPKIVDVYGPDAENIMVAYRLPGAGGREAQILAIVDMIMSNSKAGLIDLNITKKQKALRANSSAWINKDYSIFFLSANPNKGQSLDELRDLLLSQIELIKKGQFDDNLITSIINNIKVDRLESQATSGGRASEMLESFTLGKDWMRTAAELSELSTITKKDVVAFANQYLTNDYVVINKKIGEDKSAQKIVKPEITPVSVNRGEASTFVKEMLEKPAPDIKPVFIDYEKDIIKTKVGNAPLYYVKNEDNAIFKLYYVFDMGKFNDLKLPLAVNLLQFLGTDKYTSEQISKEFFKLACDFSVNVSNEQVYVSVSGLNENFSKALRLFEHLLSNAKPNQDALNQMVERILKSKTDAKLNKSLIFNRALQNYAMYGKNNPFTYDLTEVQLKALKADEMVTYIKTLRNYKHKIYYFGPMVSSAITDSVTRIHKMPKVMTEYPKAVEFKRNDTKENLVYFVNYNKMVQAEVLWLNKPIEKYNPSLTPVAAMFNEYFGGGMSSLVFQTIRESKALAYSTYSRFMSPNKKEDPYYIYAYVGTQSDKLNEAIPAMNELLQSMPKVQNNFDNAKTSLRKTIETERINDESIIFNYAAALKLGNNHDIRKDVYDRLKDMTYDDLQKFYNETYVGKPYSYCIMGSKEKIDVNGLNKYGRVMEVTLEDIFGY